VQLRFWMCFVQTECENNKGIFWAIHTHVLLWRYERTNSILKQSFNHIYELTAIEPPPIHTHARAHTLPCATHTAVRNRLAQYMLNKWGWLPGKYFSNFTVEKRYVFAPKSPDILRDRGSSLFSGQNSPVKWPGCETGYTILITADFNKRGNVHIM